MFSIATAQGRVTGPMVACGVHIPGLDAQG